MKFTIFPFLVHTHKKMIVPDRPAWEAHPAVASHTLA